MCQTCSACDAWLHTTEDFKNHLRCNGALVEEPAAVDSPTEAREKRRKEVKRTAVAASDKPNWRQFFMCQRDPVLRSQLLTAMMAGTRLDYERLAVRMLPDVVLFSAAARWYHNAEVVDDYRGLLRRTDEIWKQPDWTTRTFNSIHGLWVTYLIRGTEDFETPEQRVIPPLVGWYLNAEPPSYFSEEIKERSPRLLGARAAIAAKGQAAHVKRAKEPERKKKAAAKKTAKRKGKK
jgi:hypothetical protein